MILPDAGLSRDVHVDFVRSAVYVDTGLSAWAQSILDARELDAWSRLRPQAARHDYLAAHALARTMLAEQIHCDPSRIRFRSTPRGAPEVIAPTGGRRLRFSISYADGVALCAVATGRSVGADVESVRNLGPDLRRVADTVCTPKESRALREMPSPARAEALLRIWTLKEAAAKAAGPDVQLPRHHVEVHRENGGMDVEFYQGRIDDLTIWRLALFRLEPHHWAAVAVQREGGGQVA